MPEAELLPAAYKLSVRRRGSMRRGGIVLVSALTCAGLVACSAPPGQHDDDSPTRVELSLRDASRDTDPTPGQPGDETTGRELPTTVLLPGADGPYPVILFSHGSQGAPSQYQDLLEGWAASGFAVVAPTFPLTSVGSAGVLADVEQQPADVSFVLGQVLDESETGDGPLAGQLDPEQVAVVGHSAGAVTVLGLFRACCLDPRIDAAVVLAGTTEFFGDDLADTGIPLLFVHGDADETIPFVQGQTAYAAAPPPKAGVVLLGGDHVGPYQDPSDPAFDVTLAISTDFIDWALTGDEQALTAFRGAAERPGVATLAADELTP